MLSFVLQPAAPLTKACGQTNHGQGVGFKVHNIVLDKKMLSKVVGRMLELVAEGGEVAFLSDLFEVHGFLSSVDETLCEGGYHPPCG